jgi:hypothetical protein
MFRFQEKITFKNFILVSKSNLHAGIYDSIFNDANDASNQNGGGMI